ncbi:hypothetical protein [Marixanthomonas spongiae]|uniref:Lipoprotein n=1 Tax=Marixanthomonas spongiae TaxID=2174845 RepID=A0A2U0HXJ6_9FLAO|nr:hypothetical protein [Marixanthomonas spongiae]PVW13556.1 hypothetical protein DDV96_12940 [Marixanthomonas spongiae]
MRNILTIILLAVAVSSCGSKKKTAEVTLGTKQTVAYKSLGNGVAAISLLLFENNTFQLNFKSIPQPETNDKPVERSEKGTYTGEGHWKTLQFLSKGFDASALFDAQYNNPDEVEVLGKNKVKVNTAQQTITIWGIVCEQVAR